MGELQALTRSVLEVPDDDAPRLVIADWYEECGEKDRADFIRIQCEMARLEPSVIKRVGNAHVGRDFIRLNSLREREEDILGPSVIPAPSRFKWLGFNYTPGVGVRFHPGVRRQNHSAVRRLLAERHQVLFHTANHPGDTE
jgi:uncharacterized protein (TIGR02996 family)